MIGYLNKTIQLVKGWFAEKEISLMDWPAQSLNLNPLENLWDHLKTIVQEKNPTNNADLRTAINDAWQPFLIEKLTKLINSMPRRCDAIIRGKGQPTKY